MTLNEFAQGRLPLPPSSETTLQEELVRQNAFFVRRFSLKLKHDSLPRQASDRQKKIQNERRYPTGGDDGDGRGWGVQPVLCVGRGDCGDRH